MDNLSPERRSWVMSRIRSKDTKPEIIVRSLLHRAGYRFRIDCRDLPGRPDIVLPKYRTAIFVHGCFWHRHPGCPQATIPKTRTAFWQNKFVNNVKRDQRSRRKLRELGWKTVVVWECQVQKNPESVFRRLDKLLRGANALPLAYEVLSRRELMQVAEKRASYLCRCSK